jgi:predicted enzyme related to lactoylglutathione lyase
MVKQGKVTWNELNTRDAEAAKNFYAATLGWTYEAMPMGDVGTYWIIKSGDEIAGGIFTMSGPRFADVPDHWLPYFEVDNVDAVVGKLTGAGGTLLRAPWDIAGVGRIAILKDVGGAMLGWMKSAEKDRDSRDKASKPRARGRRAR